MNFRRQGNSALISGELPELSLLPPGFVGESLECRFMWETAFMKAAPHKEALTTLVMGSRTVPRDVGGWHGDTGGPADRGCPPSFLVRRTSVGPGSGQSGGWKLGLHQNT